MIPENLWAEGGIVLATRFEWVSSVQLPYFFTPSFCHFVPFFFTRLTRFLLNAFETTVLVLCWTFSTYSPVGVLHIAGSSISSSSAGTSVEIRAGMSTKSVAHSITGAMALRLPSWSSSASNLSLSIRP